MKPLRELSVVSANAEVSGRVKEFVQGCMFLMNNPKGGAWKQAEAARASDRVIEFTKSAAAAGTMTGWGSPLSSFQNLSTAFLGSLGAISAFDAMLSSMLVAPLRTSIIAVSASLTAGPIAEANVKPLTKLSLTASDMDAVKASALIAMTAELVRAGTPATMALVERELRTAIARATNTIFLPLLVAGTSVASSGVAATGVRQDLRTLLGLVNSGADSKLFLVTTRTIAEAWAVLQDTNGAPAFPNATVNGGSVIGGVPTIVCDEVTAGEIILVDASQVAAGAEAFTLSPSTEAILDLSTPGDLPPSASTAQTSLWQMNMVALKAERFIGAKLLRSDACAKITGVAYTGGSPA